MTVNIRSQFRRRTFQNDFNTVNDRIKMLFQTGYYKFRRDSTLNRKAGNNIPSEHFRTDSGFLQLGKGLLDPLRCFAADEQAEFLTDRAADSLIKFRRRS